MINPGGKKMKREGIRHGTVNSHKVGKAKGTYKRKSCAIAHNNHNHRLLSAKDNVLWFKHMGISASDVLDHLWSFDRDDDQEDDDVSDYYYRYEDPLVQPILGGNADAEAAEGEGEGEEKEAEAKAAAAAAGEEEEDEVEEEEEEAKAEEEEEEEELESSDDKGGVMDFCEVGFIFNYVDEEDWCLVDEI